MVTSTLSSLEEPRLKLKLCLVGEAAVGKTSLIRRFVYDQFSGEYIATLGTKVTKRELAIRFPGAEQAEKVVLMIWDIMGEKKVLDLMREGYFHGVQGLLMVSDLTRPQTLAELEGWREVVQEVAGSLPTYLLANKLDLVGPDASAPEDVKAAAERWGCKYVLTSAKSGAGVEEAFQDLAEAIVGSMEKAEREPTEASD